MRTIDVVTAFQEIDNVQLRVDGEATDGVKTSELKSNMVRITMPTTAIETPVTIQLDYRHTNFVMKTRNIFGDVDRQLRYNIMRWRWSGDTERQIDSLTITIKTDENNTEVRFDKYEEVASGMMINKTLQDVEEELEIYALDKGFPLCQKKLAFFEGGSVLWASILIPLVCIFALVVFVVCVGGSCGSRAEGGGAAAVPRGRPPRHSGASARDAAAAQNANATHSGALTQEVGVHTPLQADVDGGATKHNV